MASNSFDVLSNGDNQGHYEDEYAKFVRDVTLDTSAGAANAEVALSNDYMLFDLAGSGKIVGEVRYDDSTATNSNNSRFEIQVVGGVITTVKVDNFKNVGSARLITATIASGVVTLKVNSDSSTQLTAAQSATATIKVRMEIYKLS